MMSIIDWIATVVAWVGVVIIVLSAFATLLRLGSIILERLRHRAAHHLEPLRLWFGFRILLGLEFLIAADIIRTVSQPTLEEVAVLAGIVAIRTVISYFLERELAHRPEGAEEAD